MADSTDPTDPTDPTDTGGVSEVDDVLRLVGRLDGRPVADHVEVYETAHRQLRQVLDAG